MRHQQSVRPQHLALSPTYALSQHPSSPPVVVPQPLRRNLFATHLSRRPGFPQDLPQPAPNASTDRILDPFNDSSRPRTMASPTRQQTQPHIYRSESSTHEVTGADQLPIDSRQSPPRSVSPAKTQPAQHSTGIGSIITLDPATGRPAIPILPHLPRQLRVKDEDEDDDEVQADEYDAPEDWELPRLNQSDLQHHASNFIANDSQRQHLHELIDTTRAGDYRDYERIERVLSEMRSQQRARARHIDPVLDTPVASSISTRTRGKAKATTRSHDTVAPNLQSSQHRQARPGGGDGGIGATIDPTEKEELLSLIMSSLARKVQEAQREDWMFGGSSGSGRSFDTLHGQLDTSTPTR